MSEKEEVWRRFVDAYDIDVPESAVQNELEYIKLDLRHRMHYDQMSGGDLHLFPQRELEEQANELRAVALFEAKAPLVLKDIVAKQGFTATPEELEQEARRMAEREGSTLDTVKRFFGEDFSLLERDVVERKAIDWACEQAR